MFTSEIIYYVELAKSINDGKLELDNLDYEDQQGLEEAFDITYEYTQFNQPENPRSLAIWRNREKILGKALRYW